MSNVLGEDPEFFINDLGTADFYGLQFADTDDDIATLNLRLASTPNILIEGSKMVLDYSDISDSTDRENINTTFTSMSVGAGFTISNALYSDVVREYTSDLSASCTLASYEDYKIIATATNVGSTAGRNFYLRNFFETIPQIATNATLTGGTGTNKVINYPTGTDSSFVTNGFAVGDYVDFNTSLNAARWTISSLETDSSGREILTLFGPVEIKEENLKGTKVTASHFRKTNIETLDRYDLGKITTLVIDKESIDGKNYFTIDGIPQKNLVLFRGNMYVFIENSYPEHPIAFSTTPDGTHNDGVAFNNVGYYTVLDSNVSKRITILVPNNLFSDSMYYFCGNHSGMGAAVKFVGGFTYGSSSPTLSSYTGSSDFVSTTVNATTGLYTNTSNNVY